MKAEKLLWDIAGVAIIMSSIMIFLVFSVLQNMPSALCFFGMVIVDLIYVKVRPTWIKF